MALTAVTAYDAGGVAHVIDLAQFAVETGAAPARLYLPDAVGGMPTLRPHMGIEIDYRAGYGADATGVPAALKQALLLLVGYWFENRDAVIAAGAGGVIPPGFDVLVAPYRSVAL